MIHHLGSFITQFKMAGKHSDLETGFGSTGSFKIKNKMMSYYKLAIVFDQEMC